MSTGLGTAPALAGKKRVRAEVTKSMEARKIHLRTLRPISNESTIIPFGAILDYFSADDRRLLFLYLGEQYEADPERSKSAYRIIE